jgi:hypothetical protein
MTLTGGCLCGAVRYVAQGEPVNIRACHCRKCQKATGGVFYARARYPQAAVSIEGETRSYPSSDRIERVFCPTCGTTLFSRSIDGSNVIGVSLPTLDDPAALSPTEHIFIDDKAPWLTLCDGLAQHPGSSPT